VLWTLILATVLATQPRHDAALTGDPCLIHGVKPGSPAPERPKERGYQKGKPIFYVRDGATFFYSPIFGGPSNLQYIAVTGGRIVAVIQEVETPERAQRLLDALIKSFGEPAHGDLVPGVHVQSRIALTARTSGSVFFVDEACGYDIEFRRTDRTSIAPVLGISQKKSGAAAIYTVHQPRAEKQPIRLR
jgi:hypothetical protein